MNIEEICLRKELGDLSFSEAVGYLNNARKTIVDVADLGEGLSLTDQEKEKLKQHTEKLIKLLKEIRDFDLKNPNHTAAQHGNLERQSKNLWEDIVKSYRGILAQLKLEEFFRNPETEDVKRMKTQLEDLLSDVPKQLEELRSGKKLVEEGNAELAAAKLAHHFQEESIHYLDGKKLWWMASATAYVINFLLVLDLTGEYVDFRFINLNLESGLPILTKFLLLGVAWYSLMFFVKNYNVNAHLEAANRHRTAVANTLQDVLAGPGSEEQKIETLKQGVETMFKPTAIGFVRKSEKDSGNPLFEIINTFPGMRGDQN